MRFFANSFSNSLTLYFLFNNFGLHTSKGDQPCRVWGTRGAVPLHPWVPRASAGWRWEGCVWGGGIPVCWQCFYCNVWSSRDQCSWCKSVRSPSSQGGRGGPSLGEGLAGEAPSQRLWEGPVLAAGPLWQRKEGCGLWEVPWGAECTGVWVPDRRPLKEALAARCPAASKTGPDTAGL